MTSASSRSNQEPVVPVGEDEAAPSRPAAVIALAVLLAAQALGIAGLAVALLVDTFADNADDVTRALSMSAFGLVAAALVAVVARGIARCERWGRAPAAVIQLLALPVAVSLVQSSQVVPGVVLGVWAVAVLVLLVSPPVVRATTDG